MVGERSSIDKAVDHIEGLERNYPYWPSTFGPCPTEGCEKSGRGSSLCADCHENLLAEYCSERLAENFHNAVKAKAEAFDLIREHIETKQ